MESLIFNSLTVALTTLAIPFLVSFRGRLRKPGSGGWVTLLIMNACVNALFWIWLRSTLIESASWSYSGPLYIHWGIALGSFIAWHLRIQLRRAAGDHVVHDKPVHKSEISGSVDLRVEAGSRGGIE
jgi:hypothetical protein